jgi:hypothetical protein
MRFPETILGLGLRRLDEAVAEIIVIHGVVVHGAETVAVVVLAVGAGFGLPQIWGLLR